MTLDRIVAQLGCSNLGASAVWFGQLLDRAPDSGPAAGLAEWRHGASGGLQLGQDEVLAGLGTLTLVVRDLLAERQRLAGEGLGPGPIETGATARLLRLRDPDGNLIVLVQPLA